MIQVRKLTSPRGQKRIGRPQSGQYSGRDFRRPGIPMSMPFTSFREYVERRDTLRILDKGALPVQARINPWPTTSVHHRKLVRKPAHRESSATPKPRLIPWGCQPPLCPSRPGQTEAAFVRCRDPVDQVHRPLPSGHIGQEIVDADGTIVCWTCDEALAGVLAGLLNRVADGNFESLGLAEDGFDPPVGEKLPSSSEKWRRLTL